MKIECPAAWPAPLAIYQLPIGSVIKLDKVLYLKTNYSYDGVSAGKPYLADIATGIELSYDKYCSVKDRTDYLFYPDAKLVCGEPK